MAGGVELAHTVVFLGTAGLVVHIAQMVFALDVVLVVSDQLVFVWKLKHDSE